MRLNHHSVYVCKNALEWLQGSAEVSVAYNIHYTQFYGCMFMHVYQRCDWQEPTDCSHLLETRLCRQGQHQKDPSVLHFYPQRPFSCRLSPLWASALLRAACSSRPGLRIRSASTSLSVYMHIRIYICMYIYIYMNVYIWEREIRN